MSCGSDIPEGLHLLDHPLAGHFIGQLRDMTTGPDEFRRITHKLSLLLLIAATQRLQTAPYEVMTPLQATSAKRLSQGLAVAPVLRAGLGMMQAATELFPDVLVGTLGLVRDESTAVASRYHHRLPDFGDRLVLCLDPMLATGGSASQAISTLKASGAKEVGMVSVIAAPEGVSRLRAEHPDVPIITAALDDCLNDKKYIVPGLGDFGDRLYGTH